MSDLKVDGVIASTGTNTNLTLQGKGSGKVAIGDGALLFPDADGSDGEFIKTDGSAALSFAAAGGFTQGTEVATTSGTVVTFGSIPAGVDMIIMNLVGVSTGSNTQTILITLGDSGGLETSGYLSCSAKIADQAIESATIRHTAFFGLGTVNYDATDVIHGQLVFCLEDAANFTWTYKGIANESNDDNILFGAGSKSLSAELTQISFTTSGPGTFDAGAINIMYQ